jgi:hypothetical protein
MYDEQGSSVHDEDGGGVGGPACGRMAAAANQAMLVSHWPGHTVMHMTAGMPCLSYKQSVLQRPPDTV